MQLLNCVSLHSSLAQLRDMKRPAILMLVDDAGAQRQVVLAGIGADGAELQVGTRAVRVPISELSRYWYGDCVVLWRPARLPVYVLHPGMHGPAIHTLRTRLLQATGADIADEHSFNFDDELSQRVADFQRAHHLNVDGIAGIETQMLLDAVLAAPGTPVLQTLDKPSSDKPATVAAVGAAG
jgi:general secretion pathway protein A